MFNWAWPSASLGNRWKFRPERKEQKYCPPPSSPFLSCSSALAAQSDRLLFLFLGWEPSVWWTAVIELQTICVSQLARTLSTKARCERVASRQTRLLWAEVCLLPSGALTWQHLSTAQSQAPGLNPALVTARRGHTLSWDAICGWVGSVRPEELFGGAEFGFPGREAEPRFN